MKMGVRIISCVEGIFIDMYNRYISSHVTGIQPLRALLKALVISNHFWTKPEDHLGWGQILQSPTHPLMSSLCVNETSLGLHLHSHSLAVVTTKQEFR